MCSGKFIDIYFSLKITFLSSLYPVSWIAAKMHTIFKRGNRPSPEIYDMVLSARLGQWFKPYREQEGRGCVEHIVTLRLLMDVASRKKLTLFVTIVDFRRAYDCVPRHKLFSVLKRMGCGMTMLVALMVVYRCTNSVIGTFLFAATVGVRQGSPTSCILFVLYVNDMIQMIKQNCNLDGFLAWMHILV